MTYKSAEASVVALDTLLERPRRQPAEPDSQPPDTRYLGLADVASGQGQVTRRRLADAEDVTSRKQRFVPGDILYGRLRPELNKV